MRLLVGDFRSILFGAINLVIVRSEVDSDYLYGVVHSGNFRLVCIDCVDVCNVIVLTDLLQVALTLDYLISTLLSAHAVSRCRAFIFIIFIILNPA